MAAHDAGERVAVGDRDAGKAELARPAHQFLRMRGAAQEGEIGGDGELGKRQRCVRRHVYTKFDGNIDDGHTFVVVSAERMLYR